MERYKIEQAKDTFKSLVNPEKYLEDEFPIVRGLGLSKETIQWIWSVKKSSEKKLTSRKISGQVRMTAFDLVEVHLLLLRDMNNDPNFISPSTEEKLDEILSDIIYWYRGELEDEKIRENILTNRKWNGRELLDYEVMEIRCVDDCYKQNKTAQEKFNILTRFLNIWHHGGSNIVLETILGGFPKTADLPRISARNFLEQLNNLH